VIILPTTPKGFNVVCADPPWAFKTRGKDGEGRAPQYDVMTLADIKAMPVETIAARHAHLFMWITGPFLMRASEVMKAWGFKYSGVGFTWIKLKRSHNEGQLRLVAATESDLHVGMGYTTRKNAEFCLLGRRGSPQRLAKDVREVIMSPRREHSRKPDEFFDRVERYAEGPYVELFARESRPGWSTWGNQATKFDKVAA